MISIYILLPNYLTFYSIITQLKDLGNLFIELDKFKNTGNIQAASLDVLSKSLGKMSGQQIIARVSTVGLTDAQKLELVQTYALDAANYSNVESITAVSMANKETTASTTGLGMAFTGLGAKIKATTASMWAFLTTTPAGWATLAIGAIVGVVAAVTAYEKHVEETQQKILETYEETQSKIKDINSEYDSHKKTIDELSGSYERLSKHVNSVTNENIDLSTEDYQEYLDISNELADTFPLLQKTLDKNGNSILKLGESGKTATQDLYALLQAEKELNDYEVYLNLGNLYDGVQLKAEQATKAIGEYNQKIEQTQAITNDLEPLAEGALDFSSALTFSGNISTESGQEYYNAIKTSLEEFKSELSADRAYDLTNFFSSDQNETLDQQTQMFDIYVNTFMLTDAEKEQLKHIFQEQARELVPTINDELSNAFTEQSMKTSEADIAWNDFLPSLSQAMESTATFKELEPELQGLATDIVGGLQRSILESDEWDDDNTYAYVRKNIILPLTNLNDSDRKLVSDAYSKLLELNPNDLSSSNQQTIDSLITNIATTLGKTENEIRISLGFEVDEKTLESYNDAIQQSIEKFGGSAKEYEDVFALLGIDTEEEISNWLKLIRFCKDATIAKKLYASQNISTDSLSLEELNNQIEESSKAIDSMVSSFDNLNSAMQEQQENGRLSTNTILEMIDAGYASCLVFDDETGACTINADAMIHNAQAKVQVQMADIKMNQTDIQTKMKEDGIVAIESAKGFLTLAKAKQESTLDWVQRTGGNTNNALVDEYNEQQTQLLALEKLQGELESLGTGSYGGSSGSGSSSSKDPIEEAYEKDKKALENKLAMREITERQYYDGLEAIYQKYYQGKEKYAEQSAEAEKDLHSAWISAYEAEVDELNNRVNTGELNQEQYFIELQKTVQGYYNELNASPYGQFTKEGKEAVKDMRDAWNSAYDEQADALSDMLDDNAITEGEYINEMKKLWDKYYKDQVDFAKTAKDKKLELLRQEKSYLNTIASAASDLLSAQIEKLEAQQDKVNDKYQKRIDKIQDLIDARQEEADAVQDEIDKLNDENEAISLQQKLEEALYNQKRAHEQRTVKTYENGQITYSTDDAAIREADDAVDTATRDIQINELEKKKDAIEDTIDALEKQQEEIQKLMDESNAYFEKQIEDLQNYQNEWQKLAEFEEQAKAISNLKNMFGEDAVEQVLSGNMSLLETWKQQYIDTMAAIDMASTGHVSSITTEFGRLAEVSVNTDNVTKILAGGYDELASKADALGLSMGDASSKTKDMSDSANSVKTDETTKSMETASTAADNMVAKFNELSTEVSNFQFPALDVEKFSESLGAENGTSGVLGQLNTFIERYKALCAEIPSIWNNAMKAFSGNAGDVPAEGVSYTSLFEPLLTAMENTGTSIEAKLTEYKGYWTDFNTSLGEVISGGGGTGSTGGTDGASTTDSATKSTDATSTADGESVGGSIVSTIEEGGQAIVTTFDEVWIPGFQKMSNDINDVCATVVSNVDEMARDVVEACAAAIKAINAMNAAKSSSSSSNTVPSYGGVSYTGKAYADGTENARRGLNLLGEDGSELFVDNNGNISLVTQPTLLDMQGGETVVTSSKTEEMIKAGKSMTKLSSGTTMPMFTRIANLDVPKPNIKIPDHSNFDKPVSENNVTVNIGDIQLYGVQNESQLAREIQTMLPISVKRMLEKH